ARAPKWAPRGRGNAGGSLTASDQMARRERPATPNDAETDFRSASARRDQVASPRANHAEATKASGNAHEEEPFTAGNKSQTTDNDQASATETSPNLLSNIIPFPTSPVIIPFPGTVNRGDGACGRAAGEPAGAPAQESPLPSPTDASADNDRTSNANGDG